MVLDIIGLLITVFCLYSGMKKGFVKAFFGTASFVLALILTMTTLNPALEYIKNTEIGKTVYEKTQIAVIDEEKTGEALSFFEGFIDVEDITSEASDIQKNLSESLGDLVLRALCAIVLFLAFTIIIKLLAHILDAVAKLPLLNTFNKIGGFLAGGINAYIFMTLLTCLLMFLLSTTMGKTLSKQLEESLFTSWFYHNNPLL